MNMLKRIASLGLITLLASCGGGGDTAYQTSTAPTGPSAAKLVIQLSASSLPNSGSGSLTATATATSEAGQVLSDVPVTFSVDNNAAYSTSTAKTGANGTVVATISAGVDKSNRIVTVTALSGALSTQASFAVTGAKLTGTPIPSTPAPSSTGNRIDFRLVDANSAPIAGQVVSVSAGTLGLSTGVTDTAGVFSYTYTAPASPGVLDVTATAGGVTVTQTVQVQTAGNGSVPAAPPLPYQSASVTANPSVVSVNTTTSTTGNRSEIRALFLGVGNAPVKNVRVIFDLAGDPLSIGGTFSTGSNIVYTDINGIATTAYFPGVRSSPTNGVTIRACYGPTDFASCALAPSFVTTTLTVVSEPLGVTIGSNDKVYIGPNDLTYIRKFVVLVVDSAGRAIPNVQIVPSVDIDIYGKGQYVNPGAWVTGIPDATGTGTGTPGPAAFCFNEDINRNGVLEAGEDLNHNGRLEPRKSDVAVSSFGSTFTDASGSAIVQIEYPQNVATWARVKILVSANGISGTEGRATWTESLPAPAAAFTSKSAPAFVSSPYGQAVFVQNGITFPDDPSVPQVIHNNVQPCNNPN